ncbi:uncharacterized protein LOC123542518 [Mercenaria mercenaria]|uniref:uncharacterized protein LOC123542518 n=1 Tax=Mercenaria mercenaria TaxID=6596 RepID=UPI00234E65D4|nr:uncharacterized protein LOC123542518 [Mercenaria mercenaria]
MAEGNERFLENRKGDLEELEHMCKYENDDDNELFRSLEIKHADDFGPENISVPGVRSTPEETLLKKECRSKRRTVSSTGYKAENQCIDENSVSGSSTFDGSRSVMTRQEVQNAKDSCANASHSDKQSPSKRIHQSFNSSSDDYIPEDSYSADLGTASATTIYNRKGENAHQVLPDAWSSRAAKETSLERSTSCTDECPIHVEEILKYMCMSCHKPVCQVCLNIEHKNCSSREFIPSLVSKPEFFFEDKCKKFEEELDQLQKRLKLSIGKVSLNSKACERMRVKAKSEFKKQRDEITKKFDCLEQDFDTKLLKIESSDKEKLQKLMSRQVKIEQVLQEHLEDYYQRKNAGNASRVFTKIEMSRKITEDMKNELSDVERENSIERYVYKPAKEVTEFTKNISELGSVENVDSKTKRTVSGVNAIRMKTDGDQHACKISGLVLLSESHLLAVDYGNSSLKIVDGDNDVTSIPVTPAPFDVTLVSDQERTHDQDRVSGQIVLTLPKENKLRFMEYVLPDSFTFKQDVETNGQCRGITYSNDKLYVTFPSQGKIEIIDLQGELLKRITTETIGQLFQPQFIAMEKEGYTIFISDKETHSVFSMTTEGDVTAIFTDHDLIEPRSLCVNQTGAVFVCSFATHKIYHLSEECDLISTMGVADDNNMAPFPFSIAYCDKRDTLYVGQFTKDSIKSYKLL